MGFESRVCPRMIGWVVVEEFAGMMYLLDVANDIIIIDIYIILTLIYKVAVAATERLLVEIFDKPTKKGRSISYYGKEALVALASGLY